MTKAQREAYRSQFGQEPSSEAAVRFVEPSDWTAVEEKDEENGKEQDNGEKPGKAKASRTG